MLTNPTVSTVIVGMRDQRHIEENLACSGAEPLPPELIDALRSHRWDRQAAPWAN